MTKRFLLLAGTSVLWVGSASAQTFDPFLDSEIPFDITRGNNISVTERERPEYDPIGIRTGSILVYPSVQIGGGYSSNVLGNENNPKGDAFFALDPRVTAETDWSRHYLTVSGYGAFRRFADTPLKNENGIGANASGRLDIGQGSSLFTSIGAQRAYEPQYSGSFPTNAAASVEYAKKVALLRGTYQASRTKLILSGDVTSLNFRDTKLLSGATLDQDFRDRTTYRVSGRAEIAVSPDAAAFTQFTYSKIDYDRRLVNGGANRDGSEYRALLGTTFDLTAIMRASIGLGYIRRDYDAARFRRLAGLAADVRIQYFPSQITTVTLGFRRAIEDAIITGSSGYFVNAVDLSVDHELLRNFLLNGEVDYERNAFQSVTRADSLVRATGGGRYLVSRNFALAGNVSYIDRSSNGTPVGQQFNEWRGTLSLTVQE